MASKNFLTTAVKTEVSTEPDVVIRRWTLNDIPAVQEIALATWRATYGGFIPDEDIRAFFELYYTTEALSRNCTSEVHAGFLATVAGKPVGYARTFYNENEKRFYLNSLYVLPECQGKSLGTLLLRECEVLARAFGADEIWLGVMKQNTRTVGWYKRLGFQFEREEPFTMGKTTVDHLIGFRKLNQPLP